MTFYANPSATSAVVVIFYRDFKEYGEPSSGYKCHRGVGVNAKLTAKVLRKRGVVANVAAVMTAQDIGLYLQKNPAVTHAIIQAVWVTADEQAVLCQSFPRVHFVVRVHSQIGFLQVEPPAIKIIRDLLQLQETELNISLSANNLRFAEFLKYVYHGESVLLPNLYDMDRAERKPTMAHDHLLLRVGSFGAHRLLKNHTTAAAAALIIAERRDCDLEFYVNSGRAENSSEKASKGGKVVRRTAENSVLTSLQYMFADLPRAKLVEVPWMEWPSFRQIVASMDLCMQVSPTETFNIVTADAVCEGVPSVVSEAIEWAPKYWQAPIDDAYAIALSGMNLLNDPYATQTGLDALTNYESDAEKQWLSYLSSNPT